MAFPFHFRGTVDLKGILKLVYEGKKVKLQFPNPRAREGFRTKLYKEKQKQDRVLTDVLDEDRQTLKVAYTDKVETDGESIKTTLCDATFWLEKKPSVEYEVEVLEPEQEDGTQV